MHILERLLLYAVSVTSIALLLGEKPAEPPVPETDAPAADAPAAHTALRPTAESFPETDPQPEAKISSPVAETRSAPAGRRFSPEAIVLKDRQGRARIEMKVGSDGVPSIQLNDKAGSEIISLKVDENGQGRIGLWHENQRLEIGPEENGGLALSLKGNKTEEIRLSLSAEGEAHMIAKGQSPSTLALSSRADGAADIQIHRGPKTGGPLLSLHRDGSAAIGIADKNREYGPVMHLFEDGLAQVAVNGADSESGPTLIRTEDGTSIISVRYPNGQPAASMVGSPSGACIVSVTNTKGTQQAVLRSNKEGQVDIGVTESEAPPAPKPLPKPPKPPVIELIQHQVEPPAVVWHRPNLAP